MICTSGSKKALTGSRQTAPTGGHWRTLSCPHESFLQRPAEYTRDRVPRPEGPAKLLGMPRNIALEPLPDLPDELMHQYGVLSMTAGEYWHDDAEPMITYNPKTLRQPISFINTMAHELMHARLAPVIDEIPGGEGAHELATDLHCIIAGFGIFQLEGAEQSGWAGYMSQASRAVALSEFLRRKDIPVDQALERLSSRPRSWLQRALRQQSTSS